MTNAFVHGNLNEEVYMMLPKRYRGQWESILRQSSDSLQASTPKYPTTMVCKLKKSFHGLKQALRQWFAKLSSSLISFGFKQSKADYSFLTKQTKQGFTVIWVSNMR